MDMEIKFIVAPLDSPNNFYCISIHLIIAAQYRDQNRRVTVSSFSSILLMGLVSRQAPLASLRSQSTAVVWFMTILRMPSSPSSRLRSEPSLPLSSPCSRSCRSPLSPSSPICSHSRHSTDLITKPSSVATLLMRQECLTLVETQGSQTILTKRNPLFFFFRISWRWSSRYCPARLTKVWFLSLALRLLKTKPASAPMVILLSWRYFPLRTVLKKRACWAISTQRLSLPSPKLSPDSSGSPTFPIGITSQLLSLVDSKFQGHRISTSEHSTLDSQMNCLFQVSKQTVRPSAPNCSSISTILFSFFLKALSSLKDLNLKTFPTSSSCLEKDQPLMTTSQVASTLEVWGSSRKGENRRSWAVRVRKTGFYESFRLCFSTSFSALISPWQFLRSFLLLNQSLILLQAPADRPNFRAQGGIQPARIGRIGIDSGSQWEWQTDSGTGQADGQWQRADVVGK